MCWHTSTRRTTLFSIQHLSTIRNDRNNWTDSQNEFIYVSSWNALPRTFVAVSRPSFYHSLIATDVGCCALSVYGRVWPVEHLTTSVFHRSICLFKIAPPIAMSTEILLIDRLPCFLYAFFCMVLLLDQLIHMVNQTILPSIVHSKHDSEPGAIFVQLPWTNNCYILFVCTSYLPPASSAGLVIHAAHGILVQCMFFLYLVIW